jgi:hypothetical protein
MNEEQLRAELNAVYNSLSWRLTAPLRFISARFKGLRSLLVSPKRTFTFMVRALLQQESLVRIAKRIVNRFPKLKARLKPLVHRAARGEVQAYSSGIMFSHHAEKFELAQQTQMAVLQQNQDQNQERTQDPQLESDKLPKLVKRTPSARSMAIFFELQSAINNKKQ